MAAVRTPSPAELGHDALAEIVNLGAGHALTAMARLLGGTRAEAGVPRVGRADQLPALLGERRSGIAIELRLTGSVGAELYWLFEEALARRLGARLVASPPTEAPRLDALASSALLELGNVTASSFCNAWATLLRQPMRPGPPRAWRGELTPFFSYLVQTPRALLVVVEVRVDAADGAALLVRLARPEAERLLAQVGVSADLGF